MKLFIFVNGFFANNRDLLSQIGYVIVLDNESVDIDDSSFTLTDNIIHWSLIKCKRITRSVLASEIYDMANGVNIGFIIAAIVSIIL